MHLVSSFLQRLEICFSLCNLGKLNYLLGIEASWRSDGLLLYQSKCTHDLLECCNMLTCSDICTLMCPSNKLHASDNTQFLEESLYRSIVGGLQYPTFARRDISFLVNKIFQFMHIPTEKRWAAVKRILRYLKSTSSHGIFFSNQNSHQLQGYCDADLRGGIDDRKSTSGFAIFLGSSLVS